MSIIDKVDRAVDKVQENLSSIPHKKKKDLEEETKRILKELRKKNKQIESMGKKLNRRDKELERSQSRAGRLQSTLDDIKEKDARYEKDIERLEREVNWYKQEYKKVQGNFKRTDKELTKYKQKEQEQLKQGLHIDTLVKDKDKLAKENSKLIEELGDVKVQNTVQVKRLKSHIRGEKKAKDKVIKKFDEYILDYRKMENNLGESRKEVDILKKELRTSKEEMVEVRKELYDIRNRPKVLLNILDELLTIDTLDEFDGIMEMYAKYQQLGKEVSKLDEIVGEELGYVIEEGNVYYFITLEDTKGYVIKDTGTYSLKEGDVCRASIFKGNKVRIDEVYYENTIKHEKYTNTSKDRINRIKKTVGKQDEKMGNFFSSVYKYNIVIITSKSVRSYKEYFYKYGVIDVLDPYGEGDRKIMAAIDKADIVVVRTDAVPHKLTNYLKETKKEDTLFLYNTKSKDVAYSISAKALRKSREAV